jgi:hypothetical protein
MKIFETNNCAGICRGARFWCTLCLCVTILSLIKPPACSAQSGETAKSQALSVKSGRPLADMLEKVERLYTVPINFEEGPYESAADLKSIPLVQADGSVRTSLATPVIDFDVNIGDGQSSAFDAAQVVLGVYESKGLPGAYALTQGSDHIDVVPTQIRASAGGMRSVTPVMGSSVEFPLATRSVAETLQLVTQSISSRAGVKVILLNTPFKLTDTVTIGAAGEAARNVIANIGKAFGVPMSSQCLYDADSKTYYLNVHAVFRSNDPGVAPVRGTITVSPSPGATGSPFFHKN